MQMDRKTQKHKYSKAKVQSDRKTERRKDGKTERQKDRKTERQKDRKTERQKDKTTESFQSLPYIHLPYLIMYCIDCFST